MAGSRERLRLTLDEQSQRYLGTGVNDADVWKRFNKERFEVEVRACYCSVLDFCWTMNSTRTDPEPVEACPALAVEEEWDG